MQTLIHPTDFLKADPPEEFVLVDARGGTGAREIYQAAHLKGAIHVHLEDDLSQINDDARNGGRHPLPDEGKFSEVLGRIGIRPESHVLVYDSDSAANAAARFWWMLKAAGHEKIQVLDGGFQAAVDAGWDVESGVVLPQPVKPYPFKKWKLPLTDLEQMKHAIDDPEKFIIDVRDNFRYSGEQEPYDLVAGHIPGAVNAPYKENLDEEGFFLPPKELKEKFKKIIGKHKPEAVIVYCGSGVTACHFLLAMDHAGMQIPVLYSGSYSEWIRNSMPIETK